MARFTTLGVGLLAVAVVAIALAQQTAARPCMHKNNTDKNTEMGGRHTGPGAGMNSDVMQTIRNLMKNHEKITRTFTNTASGIRANTTSSDPLVAAWLQRHVAEMKHLVEAGGSIRECDPLFHAVFHHRNDIHLNVADIPNGVSTKEVGDTNCTVALAQAHAQVVSDFVEYGPQEARRCKPHAVPATCNNN